MNVRTALATAAWALLTTPSFGAASETRDLRDDGSFVVPRPFPSLGADPSGWERACSGRFPFCLSVSPGTPDPVARAAFDSATRAWAVLTGALDVPAPEGAPGDPWLIFLTSGVDGGSQAELYGRDPLATSDRAQSFALVDRDLPIGCELDLGVARAVARGAEWAASPAQDPGGATAQAEALARLATGCTDPIDDLSFQQDPEQTLVDPGSAPFDRGASVFFDWLDGRFGGQPGSLLVGAWSLAATHTPLGSWRWVSEPTSFDVFAKSIDPEQASTAMTDAFAQFAVARSRLDPPPRLAWRIPWPDKPRRLGAPQALEPTGVAYVEIDGVRGGAGGALRLEMQWEDYARMRWMAAKIDDRGAVLGVVPITSADLATGAAMTLEALEHVDRVLVMGANVGGTERPFDPHAGEWEPHGWLLTVGVE